MIDTAIPDTVAEGLINFDKRRKEFEVLARIRLLQGAANAYNLSYDPLFERWFHSILVLDDREAYQISCQIEPLPATVGANHSTPLIAKMKRTPKQPRHHNHHSSFNNSEESGHRKNDSIASTSSSSSSQFYCDVDSLPR